MVAARALRSLLGLSVLMLGSLATFAATPQRVGAVKDADRVAMKGGISPRASVATDLGAAAGDKKLTLMSLRFTLTEAQQTALIHLLADQQNPDSAHYHQWLTPEQFGAQFGLTTADLAKVKGWLTSQGFTVTNVARGGTFVEFSGTVAQANRAFQTDIHTVQLRGEMHVANVTAPTLPSSIAAVTASVRGLDDFGVHVRGITRGETATADRLKPAFTSAGVHSLAPGDLYTIYDENGLISGGTNGSGVTIAIPGQVDIYPTDFETFRMASGLPVTDPMIQVYGVDPGLPTSDPSSEAFFAESSFDVEWAGAMAPGATILFVTSTSVLDGSLTEAIDNNVAPIIAYSYTLCENDFGVSDLMAYTTLLQMAASEGITITAPSGNGGATDCDVNTDAQHPTAQAGLAVDFPASSPYVTAVGGTEFREGSGTYFNTTNGAYSGSAISYIPEVVWNDTSAMYGLAASGGGASRYYAKPSWQQGSGVPADSSRDVPDVSMTASYAHDAYLFCKYASCAGSSYAATVAEPYVFGGTDATSPVFAGIMALVVQKTGGRVGVANGSLYALANSVYAANVFHDTTSGNNDSPCIAGSVNCPASAPLGFAAGVGYDLATGWGSVDAGNLVNDWALVPPLTTTGGSANSVTNLTSTLSTVPSGMSLPMTATVTSGTNGATPTGSVQFTIDSVASGTPVPLVAGVAAYSLPTTGLSVGTHLVQATYLGDATYLGSKGAFTLNVTTTGTDFKLTPGTTTVTVAAGGIAPAVTYTVTALNGFTGTVTFTASALSTLSATYSFTLNPLQVTGTAGTTVLNLFAYTGNLKGSSLQSIAKPRDVRLDWERAGSGIALAGLLLLLVPRHRRIGALLMMVVALGAMGTSGCLSSSNHVAASTNVNAAPGTYTVAVEATATINGAAVTHASTVTFVVQ